MPGTDTAGVFLSEVALAWLPILFDAAVKSAILLGLTFAVAWRLGRRSAAGRHLLWFLALASLPVLPVLSALLPGWNVLPEWMMLPVDGAVQVTSPNDAEVTEPYQVLPPGTVDPSPWAMDAESFGPDEPLPLTDFVSTSQSPIAAPIGETMSGSRPEQLEVATTGAVAPASTGPEQQHTGPSLAWPWQTWCFLLWAAGTAFVLIRVGLAMLSLRWVDRAADRVAGGRPASLLSEAATEMGVKRKVILLLSDRRAMPMQWGILRPRLLLPAAAREWTADRLRMVLLHELGHVRRWDCLTQLVTQFVCATFWFNPLVWLARRRMQRESEAACDDLTLGSGFRPSDYAATLLHVASGAPPHGVTTWGAIAMARPSRLEGRLLAILDPKRDRRGLSRCTLVVFLAAVTATLVPLAMLRAASEPKSDGIESTQEPSTEAGQDEIDAEKPVGDPFGLDAAEPSPLTPPAARQPGEAATEQIPEGAVQLSHVDDSAEGKRSIGGSGHAVRFERPAEASFVVAVQIYASRYGYPQPPEENFHVYLLDRNQEVIKGLPFPYGMVERGRERWYTLHVPATAVPEQFSVGLSFNPHRTKGIYLGIDEDVDETHSYTGLPNRGFQAVPEAYDWMVRVFLVADTDAATR